MIHLSGADGIVWLLKRAVFTRTDGNGGTGISDLEDRVEDKQEVALPSQEREGIESDKSVVEQVLLQEAGPPLENDD